VKKDKNKKYIVSAQVSQYVSYILKSVFTEKVVPSARSTAAKLLLQKSNPRL
jgi:hypothetical protein